MTDANAIREEIERRVRELWGEERVVANAPVIESASDAIARLTRMTPAATTQLDSAEGATDG